MVGGWNRLLNRLVANGLVYKGEKAKSPSAVKGAIDELKAVCEIEGVDLSSATLPTKCLPYATLIGDLEKYSVIRAIVADVPAPQVCTSSQKMFILCP